MNKNILNIINAIQTGIKNKNKYITLNSNLSKNTFSFLNLLQKGGYIKNYSFINNKNQNILKIFFRFDNNGKNVFRNIFLISTPGKRVYTKTNLLWKLNRGNSNFIISTTKGFFYDQDARLFNLGGEVVCVLI